MIHSETPKLSVSLYSYTKELYTGHYSMEECLEKVAQTGAEGVEIVSTQHVLGFPKPSYKYLENFRKTMEKYNLKPACYGAYADTGLRKDGIVTVEELSATLLDDIKFAEIMGFPVIRLGYDTSLDVLYRVIDEAEKLKIKMGIEIHAPITVSHPIYNTFKAAFDKLKSPYLGFVPDFSGWATKLPDALLHALVERGMPKEIVDSLAVAFVTDVKLQKLKDDLHSKGFPESLDFVLDLAYHLVVKGNPESLKEILPQTVHIHAKFWSLDENNMETCIPYPELLSIIINSDYKGFITTEYEGYEITETYDGHDNVVKHQKMMRSFLSDKVSKNRTHI
jgi:sugar phosphate isomerase/epimerase